MLDRSEFSPPALVRRLVADAPAYGALILEGNVGIQQGYADLLAAGLMRARRNRPVVVLAEVNWEPGSRRLGRVLGPFRRGTAEDLGFQRLARGVAAAVDSPDTHYCVLARGEREIFPTLWGVDPARVHFTPFFHFMDPRVQFPPFLNMTERGAAVTTTAATVFAGGESLRDYGPLLTAAPSVPAHIRIATRTLEGRSLPHNVTAGPMSSDEFYTATAGASVVVVPLAGGRVRAAGLFTYLNAMALGKLVIVSDSLGVRDYVDDRRTGLIVPEKDPQSLAEALRWALDPENQAEVRRLAESARDQVRKLYTVDRYLDSLLAVAEEAMEIRDRRRRRRSRRYVRAA